jgi:hypothetical protein
MAAVLLGGCVGAAAQHEGLADRAYAERRYAEALVEYRLALVARAPDPALRAKAGAAALRAGELVAAAEEYVPGWNASPTRPSSGGISWRWRRRWKGSRWSPPVAPWGDSRDSWRARSGRHRGRRRR